jgi:ribosomal protein S18 acetylase RimI-like enzyme
MSLTMRAVDFAIREFRREDFEALWAIDQKCFPPGISYSQVELLAYMRRPRSFTLVAECLPDGGGCAHTQGPIGFIVAEAGRTRGHIITIDVLEHARRSGMERGFLRPRKPVSGKWVASGYCLRRPWTTRLPWLSTRNMDISS